MFTIARKGQDFLYQNLLGLVIKWCRQQRPKLLWPLLMSGIAGWSSQACDQNTKQEDVERDFKLVEKMTYQTEQAQVVTLIQLDRPLIEETMVVPANQLYKEEYIAPAKPEDKTPIDILLVVDNSGSMYEEQANLSAKMQPLLSAIRNRAWQINVITTDRACAAGDLPITPDTENYEQVFANAVKVGVNGSGWEQGIRMALDHITGLASCLPRPWLRVDAKLVVIFVSDEPDQSKIPAETFVENIEALGYRSEDTLMTHAIVGLPDKPCPVAEPDKEYLGTVALTGGVFGDICSGDYSKTLLEISESISALKLPEIKLSRVPEPTTVRVWLDGIAFEENFTVINDLVILPRQLEEGQVVRVEYLDRVERRMQLRQVPALTTLAISVNGESMDSEEFSVTETGLIRFDQALPEHAQVVARFRLNQELKSDFRFPSGISGAVECFLDQDWLVTTYDADKGLLHFDQPPLDGAVVYCLYM